MSVAIYDILLDWIDSTNLDLHPLTFYGFFRRTHISTLPSHQNELAHNDLPVSNAYVDDLATITTGPRAYSLQQQQAE